MCQDSAGHGCSCPPLQLTPPDPSEHCQDHEPYWVLQLVRWVDSEVVLSRETIPVCHSFSFQIFITGAGTRTLYHTCLYYFCLSLLPSKFVMWMFAPQSTTSHGRRGTHSRIISTRIWIVLVPKTCFSLSPMPPLVTSSSATAHANTWDMYWHYWARDSCIILKYWKRWAWCHCVSHSKVTLLKLLTGNYGT